MPTLERFSADVLRRTVIAFRDIMKVHAAAINRLNVYPVPDGDTGTNMSRTLNAVVDEVDASATDLAATCTAISHGSLMGARGNSGVILSQILRGIATTLRDAPDGTATVVADSLQKASEAAYAAVMRPIEGTILTVVRETAAAAQAAAIGGAPLVEVLRCARDAGRLSLARTPDQLAALRDAGVVDAGGAGFLLLLDAALHVVDGEALPPCPPDSGAGPADSSVHAPMARIGDAQRTSAGSGDVGDLRYEVMYFVDLADDRLDGLKESWAAIGDSIVVVGGDGVWNCHVHTNEIGAAIEAALDNGGRPHHIRVTDLFEEVADEHAHREASLQARHEPSGRPLSRAGMPAVTCAVVAVSSGDGLTDLFVQLGVQAVVSGGQTLNPSTAELLAAVEAVNADQVIVLPNNKNIVAVAQQLDALTTKHVVVVPTSSMPEALAALVVYDPEASAPANADEMGGAARDVATGEVTRAVRDTDGASGPKVAAGDWIGIVRGDGIVAVHDTMAAAATALLQHLVSANREIVTLIEGTDASGSTTDHLRHWLSKEWPDVQVEVHRGGQPLYPYLVGVE